MPSASGDVTRRSNATRAKLADSAKAAEDASRRRDRKSKRSRRRREAEGRRRRVALLYLASFAFFATALFLRLRPRGGTETARYLRAKALRDAFFSGTGKTADRGKHKNAGINESGKLTAKDANGMRYLDPRQLPPLPGEPSEPYFGKGRKDGFHGVGDDAWRGDYKSHGHDHERRRGPKVDYTKHQYEYPDFLAMPPRDGSYPHFVPMSEIFETWGQDDLDSPPETLVEVIQHFDYQDPEQMEAAIRYRDLELPFKVYNVPEVIAANVKWTDEYVAAHFTGENDDDAPESKGACQQSVDNFFAFHRASLWSVELLGPPPSVDLDWTFDQWARHAVYADEVSLPRTKKHYYWQMGVDRSERLRKWRHWTFVSRDLPSFSSPEPTFFGFNPPEQKGIQCRFGERGVTAATHYDGGRNMVAMITGAKRYILSPPNACPLLGIVTSRKHPSYRHSMLNFGRVTSLNKEDASLKMSEREQEWLRIAANAPSLSTVLKSGEVLYIPSHWFHYIVSLQKSAQCNTRSGLHEEGNENFGGLAEVEECIGVN